MALVSVWADAQLDGSVVVKQLDQQATFCVNAIKGAKETQRYPIDMQGGRYLGRQVEGRLAENRLFRLRHYMKLPEKGGFTVVVVGDREHVNSKETSQFFDSFQPM